jgi:large subunit ribosomal protein L29
MAILRKKEIRKMDSKEKDKKIEELRLELSKERAKIGIGATVTSPGRIKEIRKAIARLLSTEREKRDQSEETKKNV